MIDPLEACLSLAEINTPSHHIIDTSNMNKESRDTSSVLSEFWHDWGERRLISSGGSMAYEYAIRGCPVLALTAVAAELTFTEDIFYSKI